MKEYKTRSQQKKFYNSTAWKNKRKKILEEGNYECEWCKRDGKVTTDAHATLEVDHIKELDKHPKLALEDSNLRLLCRVHHNMRHDRLWYWRLKKKDSWKDEKW